MPMFNQASAVSGDYFRGQFANSHRVQVLGLTGRAATIDAVASPASSGMGWLQFVLLVSCGDQEFELNREAPRESGHTRPAGT